MQTYQTVPCAFYDELELMCLRQTKVKVSYPDGLSIQGIAVDLRFKKLSGEWLALKQHNAQEALHGIDARTLADYGIKPNINDAENAQKLDKKNAQLIWLRIDLFYKIQSSEKELIIPHQLKTDD